MNLGRTEKMSSNNLIDTVSNIIDSHTGYSIGKRIGVNPVQINRLKNGDRKIENISLDLANKILKEYAEVTVTIKEEP